MTIIFHIGVVILLGLLLYQIFDIYRKIYQMAKFLTTMEDAFERLGIDAKEVNDNIKNNNKHIDKLLERIAEFEDKRENHKQENNQ